MSRSQNMPERDFERALGAQLKVDGASVRLSRSPWDAVAPQMGSQRSKRPWEYVMDAINRSRLPFKPRYVYTAASALVVAIVALAFAVLINTSDELETLPVAESPELTPEVLLPVAEVPELMPEVSLDIERQYSQLAIATLYISDNFYTSVSVAGELAALAQVARSQEVATKTEELRTLQATLPPLLVALRAGIPEDAEQSVIDRVDELQLISESVQGAIDRLFDAIPDDHPIAASSAFDDLRRAASDGSQITTLLSGEFLALAGGTNRAGQHDYGVSAVEAMGISSDFIRALLIATDTVSMQSQNRIVEVAAKKTELEEVTTSLRGAISDLRMSFSTADQPDLIESIANLEAASVTLSQAAGGMIEALENDSDLIQAATEYGGIERASESGNEEASALANRLLELASEAAAGSDENVGG